MQHWSNAVVSRRPQTLSEPGEKVSLAELGWVSDFPLAARVRRRAPTEQRQLRGASTTHCRDTDAITSVGF